MPQVFKKMKWVSLRQLEILKVGFTEQVQALETAEMILSSWRVWRQVDSRRLAGGFIFGQEMRPAGSRIQDSWIECHWVKICKNPMKQNKDGCSRRCCIPGVVHIILFFWYFRVSHLSLPVNRAIAAHLELHRLIIILLLKWRWICEILLPDTAGVAPQAPSQRAPKVQASEIWAATGIRPQH